MLNMHVLGCCDFIVSCFGCFAAVKQRPTSLQGWFTRAFCSVRGNDSAQKALKSILLPRLHLHSGQVIRPLTLLPSGVFGELVWFWLKREFGLEYNNTFALICSFTKWNWSHIWGSSQMHRMGKMAFCANIKDSILWKCEEQGEREQSKAGSLCLCREADGVL